MNNLFLKKSSLALIFAALLFMVPQMGFATEDAATTNETVQEVADAVENATAATAEAVEQAATATTEALEEVADTAAKTAMEGASDAEQALADINATTAKPIDKETAKSMTLDQAIAQAVSVGKIDPAAEPGFLGIPGAPNVNLILAFFWAIWVGWIFSTVGAFGGVMAGVGHMSVFKLGNYANTFGSEAMPLNTKVTDSVRVSNQMMVGFSSLISTIKYMSLGRIVLPVGIALGVGSVAASILVPWATQGKVSFKEYQGYFGIFVLALGVYLFYGTTKWSKAKRQKANQAAKAFEEASKQENAPTGVRVTKVSLSRVEFTFCGVEFSFSTFIPAVGGFLIAAVASFLGVGGGFLIVPFLTSVTQLPMYLAAGTSAMVVLIGMVTSITTFLAGGALVYWHLIGVELVGIAIGSYVGPITAKYFPDIWLKRIFIILAVYVGLDFVLKGFYGSGLLKLLGM